MPRKTFPLAGAVLAGGRGERLSGRSKALLPLGPGGSPLLLATIAALDEVASPVLVSARADQDLAFAKRQVVVDASPGAGPLAGLVALLEASPHERLLVVACDMPSLSVPLLRHLAELSFQHDDVDAVVPRTSRGLHPLHAIYRRSLLPLAREQLARGELALHALLARAKAFEVAEEALRPYDPSLRSFENVNTPEDLARAIGPEAARRLLDAKETP